MVADETILGVFAVWMAVTLAETWLEAPPWAWRGLTIALGIAAQLLIQPSWWWLGVGIGGAAAFLGLIADLILVATDWVRMLVLRRNR